MGEKKMKKYILKTLLLLTLSTQINFAATTKTEDDVFERWKQIQLVFDDVNLEDMSKTLNESKLLYLKARYVSLLNFLETMVSAFKLIPQEQLKDGFFKLRVPKDGELKPKYVQLYKMLQNDLSGFVKYLRQNGFAADVQTANNLKVGSDIEIAEGKEMMNMLFADQDIIKMWQYLFAVGNRFYDYCFREKTFSEFASITKNENEHPIAKFIYAVMWYHLAGDGWKHWSGESLKNIKKDVDKGNEIVYIAGGSDVYQLIKHGIYNIRIIDPQLPSQPKYYTNDWEFLIHGVKNRSYPSTSGQSPFAQDERDFNKFSSKKPFALSEPEASRTGANERLNDYGIGDVIEFDNVTMIRESVELTGEKFKARIATGETIELEKSITTWGIYANDGNRSYPSISQQDASLRTNGLQNTVRPECSAAGTKSNGCERRLGQFIIERRFINQDDFEVKKGRSFLISFNELYFITAPANKGGWGINPYKFSDKFNIHVKQLHNSVSARVARNMRNACDQMEFNYIALGTCVD
jgi:hypothetical protein